LIGLLFYAFIRLLFYVFNGICYGFILIIYFILTYFIYLIYFTYLIYLTYLVYLN